MIEQRTGDFYSSAVYKLMLQRTAGESYPDCLPYIAAAAARRRPSPFGALLERGCILGGGVAGRHFRSRNRYPPMGGRVRQGAVTDQGCLPGM